MNIIRIIQALARKNVIQKNNKTGITSIPNRMNAEGEAGSIAAQLQDAGLPLEQADKIIKSEQDLIRVLNQIDQAPIQQNIENVIPFPGGGKDRRSPFDDFKASEDIYEQAQNLTPIAAMKEANNLIGRKGKYKNISAEDAKKKLGELEEIIKSEKLEPEDLVGDDLGDMLKDYDGNPEDMAMGGRAGFNLGGLAKLLKMLQGKVGKKNITTADKIARPESALNRDMFGEFNERVNRKILDVPPMPSGFKLSREKLLKNFPELDESYADQIMAMDKELQGRVLTMLKDRRKDPKAYDKLLMEKGDTLDFQGEFDRSVKRSKNAGGGLAGLLGEEPRSEYGAGGGTGAPPITYNDNVDKSGPGPTMPPNTMMNTPAIDPRMLNQGRGSGIFIDPRGLQNGRLQIPTQGLADGGRIGFKNGGMDRRTFLKLMGGLASLPIVGKLFKGAKVASKVVPLKNTTTTMPAWFPDLVDKFVAKGVRNKIDEDMIEYTVKELPDVKMIEKTDGMISVEGKNAYNEDYFIQYEPPGYTVVDEKTGKAVKTPGEFVATDTEYRMVSPEDYDIDGVNVNDIDEILGGSSNQLEGFAKGTGKTKNTIGQRRIDEADARGASSKEEYGRTERADVYDPYEGMDPTDFVDPEDFASGGLAKLLGE